MHADGHGPDPGLARPVDRKVDLVNHLSWSTPAGDSLQTKGFKMNAMPAKEHVTARRKDKRFRVKDGALAAVRPYLVDRNPIGSIVDISMSGLSFTYFANNEMAQELPPGGHFLSSLTSTEWYPGYDGFSL